MQTTTYTIKEAAKITGLPESTLRYYEKMWLINWIERDSSGYRVYSEDNLTMIATISCLNATWMPISKMKDYISWVIEWDLANERQLSALKEQEKLIAEEEKELALRKKYIKWKIKYWELVNAWDEESLKKLKVELIDLAKKLERI